MFGLIPRINNKYTTSEFSCKSYKDLYSFNYINSQQQSCPFSLVSISKTKASFTHLHKLFFTSLPLRTFLFFYFYHPAYVSKTLYLATSIFRFQKHNLTHHVSVLFTVQQHSVNLFLVFLFLSLLPCCQATDASTGASSIHG